MAEGKGHIPPWMEKIAAQGGWKEAEKTMTAMAKIKPQAWKAMGETIEMIKDFTEGGVLGGLSDIKQDLEDTLSLTIQEALAPLSNQIDQALAEGLAPIMPEIQAWATGIGEFFTISIKSWEAILTGNWDEFIKFMEANVSEGLKQFRDDLWSGKVAEDLAKGMQGFMTDINRGAEGFLADIGRGWSGFWRDLGWK